VCSGRVLCRWCATPVSCRVLQRLAWAGSVHGLPRRCVAAVWPAWAARCKHALSPSPAWPSLGLSSLAVNRAGMCFVPSTGYACSNGTGVLSADTHGCRSSSQFCPTRSTVRTPTPSGFYANPTPSGLFFNATQCESGRFCTAGVAWECPAGRYGAAAGLLSSACSGVCSAGYHCPAGSSTPTQRNCSDGPTFFCLEVRSRGLAIVLFVGNVFALSEPQLQNCAVLQCRSSLVNDLRLCSFARHHRARSYRLRYRRGTSACPAPGLARPHGTRWLRCLARPGGSALPASRSRALQACMVQCPS
jgi:hypothetical protein